MYNKNKRKIFALAIATILASSLMGNYPEFPVATSIMLVVTLATRFKFWSPKTKFGRPGHHFSRQNLGLIESTNSWI